MLEVNWKLSPNWKEDAATFVDFCKFGRKRILAAAEEALYETMLGERTYLENKLVQDRMGFARLKDVTLRRKQYLAKKGLIKSGDIRRPLVRTRQVARSIDMMRTKQGQLIIFIREEPYTDVASPGRKTKVTTRQIVEWHRKDYGNRPKRDLFNEEVTETIKKRAIKNVSTKLKKIVEIF